MGTEGLDSLDIVGKGFLNTDQSKSLDELYYTLTNSLNLVWSCLHAEAEV